VAKEISCSFIIHAVIEFQFYHIKNLSNYRIISKCLTYRYKKLILYIYQIRSHSWHSTSTSDVKSVGNHNRLISSIGWW
jgi:hypothetical protein